MFPTYERYAIALGRALVSAIFILSGISKLTNRAGTEAYMAQQGMTEYTSVLLAAAVAVELGGGVLLLLGFQARFAALALLLFMVPTTLIFHNFWAYEGAEFQGQMIHFLKNLAIMGGLTTLAGVGAGALSIDSALSGVQSEDWAYRHHVRPSV